MLKGIAEGIDYFMFSSVANVFWGLVNRRANVIRGLILFCLCVLAFIIRLFAVIRYESIIHEFDPYFNFRSTKYFAEEGLYEFWNWFDDGSWYPLGRVIGQTLFPGLMTTAYVSWRLLNVIGFPVSIKDVCVFAAPVFSGITALATWLFAYEASGNVDAALYSALFIAVCPSYMSRSVAGSYDNEAIAITALVLTYYSFVRAVRKGTILSAVVASLCYFYMISAWGGYIFVINTISLFILCTAALGRLTARHYVAYSTFYILGTIIALNIPFVNFQAVQSSEHLSSHSVFFLIQALYFSRILKQYLPQNRKIFVTRAIFFAAAVSTILLVLYLNISGKSRWSGRSMTLLDPTFASKYIPIIASVSEHQPPAWPSYIFDMHVQMVFFPVGVILASMSRRDGMLFALIYGVLAVYFSGVMIRLMLVLAPAAAVLSGIGVAHVMKFLSKSLTPKPLADEIAAGTVFREEYVTGRSTICDLAKSRTSFFPPKDATCKSVDTVTPLPFFPKPLKRNYLISPWAALLILTLLFHCLLSYVKHATFSSSFAYSHPSIVLSQRLQDGTRILQDDFREAYTWLRYNTHSKSRIMSWWDYGYQSCTMGNRTVIVDNNTWNNTHIASVGYAFASPEEEAHEVVLKLDVDYIFVVFGGVARYSGDDLNKFLWMVRIAGGIYPSIKESNYVNSKGQYDVGLSASSHLANSLIYKLSYYRFSSSIAGGFDHARSKQIPDNIELKFFKEVYTTENWLVRIYQVSPPLNRGRPQKISRKLKKRHV